MSSAFPGFSESAPGFDEPFAMLAACHDRIEAQLRILERMGTHLAARGADTEAIDAARHVQRYFETAGPNHHADEECDLFPQLEAHDELIPLLQELRRDHLRMQELCTPLLLVLQTVATGRAEGWQPQLVADFCTLYRSHMACENTRLLPVAESLLAAADKSRLGNAMVARRTQRA